ncbi:DUF4870 domain-containing protein [Ammoniphilus resinae]|uniref:Membrane protein n=1 Tax=Ammoniphilus resinae TaxID=861532 RepID=A0ABS4GPF9_9BACL|nr:DUF4870 domain-containing protein [Ammoniphilus resinae]MBP1932162.1 putative membrane protein [Ammoniphilus resinae]
MNQQEVNDPKQKEKSSTGMDVNLAGVLSYLLGIITGIIFLVLEKESRFVKFHAMQSILVSVFLILLNIVLGFIPIIGWLIGLLVAPMSLILWIYLMLQAYKGRWYKLPVLGEMAEKQLKDQNLDV